MSFGDLSTAAGLEKLNAHLANNSFVESTEQGPADVAAAKQVGSKVDAAKYPNIARWYATVSANADVAGEAQEEDDDDVDLFGSSDEEEDPEAARVREERLKEYAAKKAAKGPKPAAKSMVTLDVKGWDDETDMEEMLAHVKSIQMDGLVWGGHQFIPVGFGMQKLQINCVVEDDKVPMDDITEQIEADEDHVQSVDVAAMQKI